MCIPRFIGSRSRGLLFFRQKLFSLKCTALQICLIDIQSERDLFYLCAVGVQTISCVFSMQAVVDDARMGQRRPWSSPWNPVHSPWIVWRRPIWHSTTLDRQQYIQSYPSTTQVSIKSQTCVSISDQAAHKLWKKAKCWPGVVVHCLLAMDFNFTADEIKFWKSFQTCLQF